VYRCLGDGNFTDGMKPEYGEDKEGNFSQNFKG
jgi:hypothetical protein